MIPLTLLVSAIAIVFALRGKPGTAVGILICSMMLYPDYLRVPIGPVKMSAPRFVAVAMLIKHLLSGRDRKIKWTVIDAIILFEWLWAIAANLLAGSQQSRVFEVIGRVFDSVLMYFIARIYLSETGSFRDLARPLIWCAIIIGTLGIVESITGKSPYYILAPYSAINNVFGFETVDVGAPGERRFGFMRAAAACSSSIYYGMAMAIIMGILYAARDLAANKKLCLFACLLALLGSVSSMSSGPQSALIIFVVAIAMEWIPHLIKPATWTLLAFLLFCEFASNRHVWYLIEYINPAGGDSWYRSQLITVAIQQWRDYWLVGVGDSGVNHWGPMIDGRLFTDVVNEYVMVGLGSGFLGLASRLTIQVGSIRHSITRYRLGDLREKKLAYGLAATLLSIMVGGLSVASFGPPLLLMYLVIGMMVRPKEKRSKTNNGSKKRVFRKMVQSKRAPETRTSPSGEMLYPRYREMIQIASGGVRNVRA